MPGLVRLLGLAPAEAAAPVQLAMTRHAGPPLSQQRAGDMVAFAQPVPGGPRPAVPEAERQRALLLVQRRLEAACLAGPFLPAAPAAALCPAAELPALLEIAAPRLRLALAEHAGTHQWSLTLRWPEAALQAAPGGAGAELARRARRVEAALRPALLRVRREAETAPATLRYLLLVPRGQEAAIETALLGLPPETGRGAVADLHGPMPPLGFHAWQVAEAEAGALRAAWALLGPPEGVEVSALRPRHGLALPATPAQGRLAPLFREAGPVELARLLPLSRRRLVPCDAPA